MFSPGIFVVIAICICTAITGAATLYLTRYEFKNPKIRKHLIIFALSLFGLVVVYILFYTISNLAGRAQVQTQLEEMRKRNILLDAKDVCPSPTIDVDNGAYSYKAAFELMDGSASCNKLFELMAVHPMYDVTQWPEKTMDIARELLRNSDIELILSLFRQAAEKPYVVYKRKYAGYDTLLPELTPQRALFRLISLKSSSDGFGGKPESGYRLLSDGFKTIVQLQNEKILISQLVNIASTSINIEGVNNLLVKHGISAHMARQLLAELGRIDFRQAMRNGLDGQIAMSNDLFEKLNSGKTNQLIILGNNETLLRNILSVFWLWPFWYQDYAYYLTTMNKLRDLYGKPYWLVADEVDVLKNENCRLGCKSVMTSYFISSLPDLRTKVANIESEIEAMKLTLALHIYKNQHGAFPDKLEELAPGILKAIPVDPVSGKPFEYRSIGSSFTISSVWLKEKQKTNRKRIEQNNSNKRK